MEERSSGESCRSRVIRKRFGPEAMGLEDRLKEIEYG
jgi:hypothetical protein